MRGARTLLRLYRTTRGRVCCQPSHRHSTAVLPSAVGFNDYEHACNTYTVTVPQYFNFGADIIDQWADREKRGQHSTPAFWWVGDRGQEFKWSYSQLSEYSHKAANVFEGPLQLKKGDRVLVILPRVPQWWLLNLASARTGVVMLPGTIMLTPGDIKYRILSSNADCIITYPPMMDKVDSILDECPNVRIKAVVDQTSSNTRPDWYNFDELMNNADNHHQATKTKSTDPLQIFFTSGTTGRPKMALHTQASYGIGHNYTGELFFDLVPGDVLWNISDTGWAKAAYCSVFATWIRGSCVFTHYSPNMPKFDPQHTLQMLEKYPVSVFFAPPTAYAMKIQEKLTDYKMNDRLRHCTSAGEPMSPEVAEAWTNGTGLQVRQAYGQTEMVVVCASWRCIPDKPGSMGKASPGVNITVVDESGNPLGVDKEGDIGVCIKPERPFWLFQEYLNDPVKSRECIRGDYYMTGDRAYVDKDGYFWFVGRSDDIITSAGYRIGPFEVESVLIEHPAVVESAVVSSPDPTRGEVVKAFVILSDAYKGMEEKALIKELQAHVKATTAPYKYPRKIEFLEQLPKTISGKIRRVELRQREREQSSKS